MQAKPVVENEYAKAGNDLYTLSPRSLMRMKVEEVGASVTQSAKEVTKKKIIKLSIVTC